MKKLNINNICIIGAGAIGTFYGAKLQNTDCLVQYYSPSSQSKKRKIQIKSIWGDFDIIADFYSDISQINPADLIILSTKALETISSGSLIHSVIHEKSIILVLQNGINEEEELSKKYPQNPVMGGLAFTCINRMSPNEIHHIDYGTIKIGALNPDHNQLASELVEFFKSAGIQTIYGEPLRLLRWQKLLWNIPYNSLSVAAGMITTEQIIEDEKLNDLSHKMMKEVQQIALSEGIHLSNHEIETMQKNTRKMKPYKTSMMIDYQKKRPMEIESILGEPLRIAKKNKVNVPIIETIYSLLSFYNKSHHI